MMKCPHVGLLPFYLKMHDDFFPARRAEAEAYLADVADRLRACGLLVTAAPVCRLKPEFDAAAKLFNASELDAVITLHLVYSPSLEAIDALASLSAPLIVLDTTPDDDFGTRPAAARIRPNIGIHGVQDMCSLLTRRQIPYTVTAGPLSGDVIGRTAALARCAAAARCMREGRVGAIGGVYPGMGDFRISPERMREELGAEVVPADFTDNAPEVSDAEIDALLDSWHAAYDVRCPDGSEDLRASARASLMTRKWLESEQLCAFTANFMGITKVSGLPRTPFVEASEAMSRGIGYAGEGDTLTALLFAALRRICPDCAFTEMFAPGWNDGSVFLSHMGEINPALCARQPVVGLMDMVFSDVGGTACLYGALKAGEAILVNLVPLARNFRLLLAPVSVFERPNREDFRFVNEGWFRPHMPLPSFLECFSRYGGTHHSVLCYDADIAALQAFGGMMGFDVRVIEKE